MKRTYIILFLATNILSTSCMDILRRRKSRTSSDLIPVKTQHNHSASPKKQVEFLEEKSLILTIIPEPSTTDSIENQKVFLIGL